MYLENLTVKLFSDGADLAAMREMVGAGLVRGLTTNPSLCRKAGVSDYLAFASAAANEFPNIPLSLEVIADDPENMIRQALILSELGPEIRVKVPILNCHGEYNTSVIKSLGTAGVKLNITACLTEQHVQIAINALTTTVPSYVSVFAGRISDTGVNPLPTVRYAVKSAAASHKPIEVIWASVRQPFDVVLADSVEAQIITIFPDFLRKLRLFGKDLHEFAIETTQMFTNDAGKSGYIL